MKTKYDSENIWDANEVGATAYVHDRKTTLIFIGKYGKVFKQNRNGFWFQALSKKHPLNNLGSDKRQCIDFAKYEWIGTMGHGKFKANKNEPMHHCADDYVTKPKKRKQTKQGRK